MPTKRTPARRGRPKKVVEEPVKDQFEEEADIDQEDEDWEDTETSEETEDQENFEETKEEFLDVPTTSGPEDPPTVAVYFEWVSVEPDANQWKPFRPQLQPVNVSVRVDLPDEFLIEEFPLGNPEQSSMMIISPEGMGYCASLLAKATLGNSPAAPSSDEEEWEDGEDEDGFDEWAENEDLDSDEDW